MLLFVIDVGIYATQIQASISKSSLQRAISSVRKALMNPFVPSKLGFSHITREEVIRNHTRPLAQSLFGDNTQAIIVLDGTYIFIEKSNNFVFQRRSYSMHKGRPLVKRNSNNHRILSNSTWPIPS